MKSIFVVIQMECKRFLDCNEFHYTQGDILSEFNIVKPIIYYSNRFTVSGGIIIAVHKYSIQGYGNQQ